MAEHLAIVVPGAKLSETVRAMLLAWIA
jgi:hypothetical protein